VPGRSPMPGTKDYRQERPGSCGPHPARISRGPPASSTDRTFPDRPIDRLVGPHEFVWRGRQPLPGRAVSEVAGPPQLAESARTPPRPGPRLRVHGPIEYGQRRGDDPDVSTKLVRGARDFSGIP